MKQKSNKYLYGLILVIFAMLFALKKAGVLAQLPYGIGGELVSTGVLFIIAGIVLIVGQPKQFIGWTLLGIGLVIKLPIIYKQIGILSNYILPIGLLIVGISLMTSDKNK